MSINEVYRTTTVGRTHDIEYLTRIEFIPDGYVRVIKTYDTEDGKYEDT